MFINSLLTLPTDQNIASSWLVFTFLGGLIGLSIGIALVKPLSYGIALVKPLDYLLQKCLSFIEEGESQFLLMIAMPMLSPILGIGVGVSVSQSIFLSKLGINKGIFWILFTSFAHFIPTILYSVLIHAPTALGFSLNDLKVKKKIKNIKIIENILVFFIWGNLIGFAQALLIGEHFSSSGLWYFFSALGISIGIFIGHFIFLLLSVILGRASYLLLWYSIGLVALIPYGFFTGIILELSLKQGS